MLILHILAQTTNMTSEDVIASLHERIAILEKENQDLMRRMSFDTIPGTVIVPDQFKEIFDQAEKNVASYFSEAFYSPEHGEIEINGERYILIRSAALSFEFHDIMRELYKDHGGEEAERIGNNFLFDIGQVLGKKDAKSFHEKMGLNDPVEKLSAGPVHFAYTGWANVEILPGSNPSPDQNFILKYRHHNSFEAQSWKRAKRKSTEPVCIMNCGYSAGWCEESFGIHLTAVEITCEAKGDENCTFIMAPTNMISKYLKPDEQENGSASYNVPVFFQRKAVEDKLMNSLQQKETLLKEVHHRVKNNLQIIASLFRLQLNGITDSEMRDIFQTGVNRVTTMAKIHELIYSDPNLSSINIEEYFRKVLYAMLQVYEQPNQKIDLRFEFNVKEGNFNPDKAIPLGLILNEIASNAFKHAFINREGILNVVLTEEDNNFTLTISDNGPGMDENSKESGLGLSLIELLCDQIDAQLESLSSKSGLSYTIRFEK
jgi:two-component sensor histidine kinase/predicted hydrocarbon binding protein